MRKINLFPVLWSAGWNLQIHATIPPLTNPYLRTKCNSIVEKENGERWSAKGEDEMDRRKTHDQLIDAVGRAWTTQTSILPPISSGDEAENLRPSENTLLRRTKSILLPKINLVDLPLSQVIQVLSELSEPFDPAQKGVNLLLIDPKKKNPAVTLNLRNVSLHKVLHYIARMTQFHIKFEHDVIVFSEDDDMITKFFPVSRGTVIQIVENSNEIKDAPSTINPEETILRRFFQKSGIPFDVPGSGFAFDGNQFIVTHTSTHLKRFENLLKRYRNIQQVSIEAKFLEVQQGALEETGIKWQLGETNQTKIQTGGKEIDNLRSLSTLDKVSSAGDGVLIIDKEKHLISNHPPLLPSLNGGKNVTPVGHIVGVLNRYQTQCFLQALEQHTDTDLMSAPKLTVLSGKRAEIIIAQELRYPEHYGDGRADVGNHAGQNTSSTAVGSAGVAITAGTPSHFVTRNVGVEMSVLPTVERNNCISLKLEPSVTEFDGFVEYGGEHVAISGNNIAHIPSGFFQPIFSRRQIKTEVTVFNGATVVMGGLTREEVKEVRDKIPFLGSLPLLGPLFRSKGQTSQKRNLLIFVTANRLDPAGVPTVESGKKMGDPRETKHTISIETPPDEF